MKASPLPLRVDGRLRYACRACGECCRRGFAIHCPAADEKRLGAIDWAGGDAALAGEGLFLPHGSDYRLALNEEGACRFLAPDHRCRMHTRIGYDAKLLTCKMFPVFFRRTGSELRAGLLFSCPAVCDGEGPLLAERRDFLESLRRERDALAGGCAPDEAVEYRARERLDLPTRERLATWEAAAADFLADTDGGIPWNRRLLGLAVWLEGMASMPPLPGAEALFAEWAEDAGRRARESAENGAFPPTPLTGWEALWLRQLIGLCVAMWEPRAGVVGATGWRARGHRIGLWLRHAVGRGKAGWPFGDVPLSTPRTTAPLPERGGELLARYMASRVATGSYYGRAAWGLPVVPGLRLTASLPAVATVLSRLAAAAAGRDAPVYEDVRLGVMMTDHTFGHLGEVTAGAWFRPALSAAQREGWPMRALRATVV